MKTNLLYLVALIALSSCLGGTTTSNHVDKSDLHQVYWGQYFEDEQRLKVSGSYYKEVQDGGMSTTHLVNVRLTGLNHAAINGNPLAEKQSGLGNAFDYIYEYTGISSSVSNQAYNVEFTDRDGAKYNYAMKVPLQIKELHPYAFRRNETVVIFWQVPDAMLTDTISHHIDVDAGCGIQMPVDTKLSNSSGKIEINLMGSGCGAAKKMQVRVCREHSANSNEPSKTTIMSTYCSPKFEMEITN